MLRFRAILAVDNFLKNNDQLMVEKFKQGLVKEKHLSQFDSRKNLNTIYNKPNTDSFISNLCVDNKLALEYLAKCLNDDVCDLFAIHILYFFGQCDIRDLVSMIDNIHSLCINIADGN